VTKFWLCNDIMCPTSNAFMVLRTSPSRRQPHEVALSAERKNWAIMQKSLVTWRGKMEEKAPENTASSLGFQHKSFDV
jgi:hypothetical protein